MKRSIEVQGKKVEDAIAEGLRILGVTMDEADIKIISAGGLFKKAKIEISTGEDEPVKTSHPAPAKTEKQAPAPAERPAPVKAEKSAQSKPAPAKTEKPASEPAEKPVKIENARQQNTEKRPERPQQKDAERDRSAKNGKPQRNFEERAPSAPVKPEYVERIKGFLDGLLKRMSIEGSVVITEDDGMKIEVETADSAVIGHRGEVLDALQYLCSLIINEMGGRNVHISLNALGYREKRIDTLKRLAEKTAQRCVKINRKISMEPMSSAERRVIHAALSENADVFTRSEGHEPARRVIVVPVRK